MVGDENDACLDTNLRLKQVMPKSGHLLNLEDPVALMLQRSSLLMPSRRANGPIETNLLRHHAAPKGLFFNLC